MALVICVCSVCSLETFADARGTHSGRRVAPSTRSSHERNDRDRALEPQPSAPLQTPVEDADVARDDATVLGLPALHPRLQI